MTKHIQYSLSILVVTGLWSLGFFQGTKSWNAVVYNSSKKPQRHLASISSKLDLSNIVAIYPEMFEKQSLVDKAYVIENQNITQIYLAHISTNSSAIKLVCRNYSHLQLILHASDVNINGEPLEMKLTGLCNVSKNINFIDPINLPIAKIKKLESSNFRNDEIFLENSYFLHMSSEWMITKVNFFSKKGRSLPNFSVKATQPFEVNLQE